MKLKKILDLVQIQDEDSAGTACAKSSILISSVLEEMNENPSYEPGPSTLTLLRNMAHLIDHIINNVNVVNNVNVSELVKDHYQTKAWLILQVKDDVDD